MFQEHNEDDLATNWQSVCGNRLKQGQSNFPPNTYNEDIGPLAHWIFSTDHFTAQTHSHQAASENRHIEQKTQNLERWQIIYSVKIVKVLLFSPALLMAIQDTRTVLHSTVLGSPFFPCGMSAWIKWSFWLDLLNSKTWFYHLVLLPGLHK